MTTTTVQGRDPNTQAKERRRDYFRKIAEKVRTRNAMEIMELRDLQRKYSAVLGKESIDIKDKIAEAERKCNALLSRLEERHDQFTRMADASDATIAFANGGEHEGIPDWATLEQREKFGRRSMSEDEHFELHFPHLKVLAEQQAAKEEEKAGPAPVTRDQAIAAVASLCRKARHISQILDSTKEDVLVLLQAYQVSQAVELMSAAERNSFSFLRLMAIDLYLIENGAIYKGRIDEAVAICNVHMKMKETVEEIMNDWVSRVEVQAYADRIAQIRMVLEHSVAEGMLSREEFSAKLSEEMAKVRPPSQNKTHSEVSVKMVLEIYELLDSDTRQLYDFLEFFQENFSLSPTERDRGERLDRRLQLASFHGVPLSRVDELADGLGVTIPRNGRGSPYTPSRMRTPGHIFDVLREYVETNAEGIVLNERASKFRFVKDAYNRGLRGEEGCDTPSCDA